MNEVYYRIIFSLLENEFVVCTLQGFDEVDYDKDYMLPLKFKDEKFADSMASVLNENNDKRVKYSK